MVAYSADGSYIELNSTVLVTCFLHLLSFFAKGSSTSLPLFYMKMRLGMFLISKILNKTKLN